MPGVRPQWPAPANAILCHRGTAGGTGGAVGARVARIRVAGRIRAPAYWSPSSSSTSSQVQAMKIFLFW